MSGQSADDKQPTEAANALWQEWITHKRLSTRNDLIQEYLPWVRRVAAAQFGQYRNYMLEFEDYVHYGILGLLQSIDRYVPDKGAKFETFAYPRVRGAIIDGISDKGAGDRASQEQMASIIDFELEHNEELVLSSWVNIIVEMALIKLVDLGYKATLQGAKNPLDIYTDYRQEVMINELVEKLEDVKKLVIESRYKRYMTFSQIAEILNVSKGRVSQIHALAIQDLRKFYQKRY